MSLDTRLREHLHRTSDSFPQRPADLDAVMTRGQRRRTVRLGAVACVAVVAITGAVLLAQAMPPEETVVTEVPTSVSSGWVAYSTWPRPGQGAEIFLVREGEQARAIAAEDGPYPLGRCPTFSPDGSMLAYLTQPENTQALFPERSVIVLGLDADSTAIDLLLTIEAPRVDNLSPCPKWSPDSSNLAFRDGNGIAIVDLAGSRRDLAIPEGAVAQPPWMAPGRLLWSWAWTPDSGSIATVYDSALWAVPVVGGEPALVTDSETLFGIGRHLNSLQWSPDGTEILVSFSIEPENDGSEPVADDTFFIGRVRTNEGGEVTDIVPGRDAQWSPDGAWILYLGPTTGDALTNSVEVEPKLVNSTTGEIRTLGLGSNTYGHVWSPDSTRLVFTGDPLQGSDGALFSMAIGSGSSPVVLVGPTRDLDYTGGWAREPQISWQPVHE